MQSASDQSAFDWIRGISFRDREHLPRTTGTDLEAAEKALNVRLPASYCAFALRFGLGGTIHTLPELLPLFPPPGRSEYWWYSVVDATRFHRSAEAEGTAPPDFLQRAVVFGIDQGTHVPVPHRRGHGRGRTRVPGLHHPETRRPGVDR